MSDDFVKRLERARTILQELMETQINTNPQAANYMHARGRARYIENALEQIDALLHIEEITKKK